MNESMENVEPDITFFNLLELAGKGDVNEFKKLMDRIGYAIKELGVLIAFQRRSTSSLMENRTPLMIAARYGIIDVVKFILSISNCDVNTSCGPDKTTALHCAASSGSHNAFVVIRILLNAGANPELIDANGLRPVDVVPPNEPGLKIAMQNLIERQDADHWMFEFKIFPCSETNSHDWRQCQFFHPGENARRRDPQKIGYNYARCANFKEGQCRFGDACEFAHGDFETWLHPKQFRTKFCKEGYSCTRRVCFFAHTPEQLRQPPYVSLRSLPSSSGYPATANRI